MFVLSYQSIVKKLDITKIDSLILNAGAQFVKGDQACERCVDRSGGSGGTH
jgi:hypothetical protein